ncbi:F-box domain-containing protein [Favolaschia claudopus]|uniref:F-box domain-containing protein n=1 Tax=Favolaschia claudopus TaxID=2862362 RepID=A0AAW0A8C5_9AGAR
MLHFMETDRFFVAQSAAQVLKLEAQILEIQNSLSILRAAKSLAEQRLRSYIYPILSLPIEITTEIFLHSLPPYPDAPPLSGRHSPTRLSHVCRHWRAIALRTPQLWRAMKIFGDTLQEVKKAVALAPLWLARSGHQPLSLDTVDSLNPALSSALLEHRERWEHLALSRRGWHLLKAAGFMPMLHSLKLRYLGSPSLKSSRNVPRLRTVLLDACMVENLPWSQLTSLTLRYIATEECRSILRQTAQLVDCSLYPWDRDVPRSDAADLMLLCLERLTLEPGGHFDDDFLASLVTPSLVKLELPEIISSVRYPSPIGSLKTFVAKSGCTLQELHIRQSVLPTHAYHDAFPRIPMIAVEPRGSR